MKTSFSLLKKYVSITTHKPLELVDKLTMNGLEVEEVHRIGGGFDKIVVGHIQKKEQHPNADKLTLCKVDVGGEILSIICGAKNHQEGDKVVVSMIGAVLPGGMEIKRAKLRGVESEGMICSKTELGLAASSDGVWILPPETPVGASINTLLPEEDYVYDVSITANRSDCLSTLGVAREVAIIEGKNVTYPKLSVTEDKTAALPVITIRDQNLCHRYASRIVRGVKVGPSPEWLQEALGKYGARSINNIVDITNYVMFELGQPLHAFDLAKLDGKEIVVRRAAAGEKLVTLDEVERTLDPDMLIIADKTRPVAIAGVMGGANSEVDAHTVDLLLESAYFVPHSVRKTAKLVGLRSEASYRFERDVDPENTVRALDMCAQMILELAGGKASGLVDNHPVPHKTESILVRPRFVEQMLGFKIGSSDLERIFGLLEFDFSRQGEDYQLCFPSFRRDCSREIDVVEEIIRVYGYDNIPESVSAVSVAPENFHARERLDIRVRNLLLGLGLSEAYNFTFINQQVMKNYNLTRDEDIIVIKNPLNQDYDALRTNILPSLLQNVKLNQEKSHYEIALFELGKVFWQEKASTQTEASLFEKQKLALVLSGNKNKVNWVSSKDPLDFFHLKGILEELFVFLKIDSRISFQAASLAHFHPGKTAKIFLSGQELGFMGEVHPDAQAAYDIKTPVLFAELDFELLKKLPDQKLEFQRLSKYPSVEREIAFLLEQKNAAAVISDIILNESPLIQSVNVVDVYEGKSVPDGKRSVSFSFVLQAMDRTLTDEEIHGIMDSIIKKAGKAAGASLREA